MTLDEYCRRNRITYRQMADRLNDLLRQDGREGTVTLKTTQKWASGDRIPRRDMMPFIHRATLGEVGPADFYPEFDRLMPGARRGDAA